MSVDTTDEGFLRRQLEYATKGAAALEVLRFLVACGLSTERLGFLIVGGA